MKNEVGKILGLFATPLLIMSFGACATASRSVASKSQPSKLGARNIASAHLGIENVCGMDIDFSKVKTIVSDYTIEDRITTHAPYDRAMFWLGNAGYSATFCEIQDSSPGLYDGKFFGVISNGTNVETVYVYGSMQKAYDQEQGRNR